MADKTPGLEAQLLYEHERAELAEQALAACVKYGHGYRFPTIEAGRLAGAELMTTAEQIAAKLAELEVPRNMDAVRQTAAYKRIVAKEALDAGGEVTRMHDIIAETRASEEYQALKQQVDAKETK
jgi:hypothetical protein